MTSDNIDKDFVQRIEFLVDKLGGQSALARVSGLSLGAIQRYLRGGEPTRRALICMAKAGGVAPLWLLTGEKENYDIDKEDDISIPVYGFAETKQKGWYEEIPWKVSSALDWPDPHIFAVVTIGKGMKPEGIDEGQLCIASPSTKARKNDAIYIKKTDGTSSIKKFEKEDDKWIYISGYFEPDENEKQISYSEQLNKEIIEQIAPIIFVKRRI